MNIEQLTQQAFNTYMHVRRAIAACRHSVRRERLEVLRYRTYARYQRRQIKQFE